MLNLIGFKYQRSVCWMNQHIRSWITFGLIRATYLHRYMIPTEKLSFECWTSSLLCQWEELAAELRAPETWNSNFATDIAKWTSLPLSGLSTSFYWLTENTKQLASQQKSLSPALPNKMSHFQHIMGIGKKMTHLCFFPTWQMLTKAFVSLCAVMRAEMTLASRDAPPG